MGSIKAGKFQAMKKYRRTQFVIHNLLHLVAAILLTCSLIFSNFPSLCSSMKQFALISLPCIWSSFFNPKCLFIVVNVIVIFLVGESGFVGSTKSPAHDLYDEYIERSRGRLRGVSVSTTHQEVGNEDKVIDSKEESEEFEKAKENEDQYDGIKEEKELFEVKEVITCEAKSLEEEITCEIGGEENNYEENGREIVEDHHKEVELPAEELNKRVEEFIARVNKQRWMEAQLLVCCKA